MRLILLTLALIAGFIGSVHAAPYSNTDGQISFKDWSIYCTPRDGCEASTLTLLGEENHMQTRLNRGWGIKDGLFLSLNLGKQQQAFNAGLNTKNAKLSFEVANTLIWGFDHKLITEGEYGSLNISSPLTPEMVAALANGDSLEFEALFEGETLTTKVSLSGLSAALRYMDEFQARVGTTSALIAKGNLEMAEISPPAFYPKTPQDLPEAVRNAWQNKTYDCAEYGEPEFDYLAEGHRLQDYVLWILPCGGSGAYNAIVSVFVERSDGSLEINGPMPLPTPFGDGLIGWDTTLANAAFDAQTSELVSFFKGRGIGDCGLYQVHQWQAGRLALKEARSKQECDGAFIEIEQWPLIFQAGVN